MARNNPGVVEADRPEAIDRHILHVDLVDRRAIILAWRDVEINRILIGIEAPARRGDDQVPDRIDLRSRRKEQMVELAPRAHKIA